MQKTKIIMMSLLMLQASSLASLHAWEPEDNAVVAEATRGQRVISKRLIGFQDPIHRPLERLIPFQPLPDDLGQVVPQIMCTLEDNQSQEVALPPKNLVGRWISEPDQDRGFDEITLLLEALVDGRFMHVKSSHPQIVNHELVREGEINQDGYNLFYDNNLAYATRNSINTYRIPGTQQEYRRAVAKQKGNPLGHVNTVVFAEPFPLGDDTKRENYRGNYRFIRDLNSNEKIKNREKGRLIYAEDGSFYWPTVTQELWQNDEFQVGFFLVSKFSKQFVQILDDSQPTDGNFEDGLYQLVSFEDKDYQGKRRRHEKYQKLGPRGGFFHIVSPGCFFSIPGMGGSAPYNVPENGTEEVKNLRQSITEVQEKVEDIRDQYARYDPSQVIVIGPTGSGKSTLITGLFRDLFARDNADIEQYELEVRDPLPGFRIGAGAGAGTRVPGAWYDEIHNTLYWDCPGFEDPAGNFADIVNAFAILQVFSNHPTKVVLSVNDGALNHQLDRGGLFYRLLDQVVSIFPNEQQIQDALTLVVAKGQDRPSPQGRLNALFNRVNGAEGNVRFSQEGQRLLGFLRNNPERSFPFKAPQEDGLYPYDRNGFENCLDQAYFVAPLRINLLPNLSPGTREQCAIFAQGLNQYLVDYLRTEGAQRLFNYCRQRMDNHQGTSQTLRDEFGGLINGLRPLRQVTHQQMVNNHDAFLNPLRDKIDVTDIIQSLNQIEFLRQINQNINYTSAEYYIQGLRPALLKIKNLTERPTAIVNLEKSSGVINGIFLGMSDIMEALNDHPGTHFLAVAGYRFYFDSNFNNPGRNLRLSSPYASVYQSTIINLSGTIGENGENGVFFGGHGQPGKPGGNGGAFYFFTHGLSGNPSLITVNSSGGRGGKGGNGARGASGKNGKDGDLNKVTKVSDTGNKTYHYANVEVWRDIHTYYQDKGGKGEKGGTGGSRGAGGLGGLGGLFQSSINNIVVNNNRGKTGDSGNPGIGGTGGKDGRDCEGYHYQHILVSTTGKDWCGVRPGSGWQIKQAHVSNNRRGADGSPGRGVNTAGRQNPQRIETTQEEVDEIRRFWQQIHINMAQNIDIAPFLGLIPSFEVAENEEQAED